jgi:cysteine desulfurase
VRPSVRLTRLLHGGAQERGLRPGTQDPALGAGLVAALDRLGASLAAAAAVAERRDWLERELTALGEARGCRPLVNGTAARIAFVCNLSWPGRGGPELCAALDLEGLAVSAGAACSAGTAEPSAVVQAMHGKERAASAVRISLGEETTEAELALALRAWDRVLQRGEKSLQL